MALLVAGQQVCAYKLLLAADNVASENLLGLVCLVNLLATEGAGPSAIRLPWLTIQLVPLKMFGSGVQLAAARVVTGESAWRPFATGPFVAC